MADLPKLGKKRELLAPKAAPRLSDRLEESRCSAVPSWRDSESCRQRPLCQLGRPAYSRRRGLRRARAAPLPWCYSLPRPPSTRATAPTARILLTLHTLPTTLITRAVFDVGLLV